MDADCQSERFGLTWPGKREALRAAHTPSQAALVPSPDESLDFDTAGNVFVEGDNLEVLKLLQAAYTGRIKLIYIDPPYNTGADLIYPDDFSQPLARYLELTGQADAAGNQLSTDAESSGRYHSAWLSMLYPRLVLARQLLRPNGVLMVSIDDHEMHTLRLLLDELFGEERFLGAFVWRRRSGAMDATSGLSTDHEYVLCYGNTLLGQPRTFARYANPDADPRGPWIADNLSAAKPGGDTFYPIVDPASGREYWPPKGRYWPYNRAVMRRKIAEGRILFPSGGRGSPMLKRFQREARSLVRPVSSWIGAPGEGEDGADGDLAQLASGTTGEGTREIKQLFGDKVFLYAKPVSLLRALIEQGTSAPADCAPDAPGEIVLDFFAGSATTAQAVLELNARDSGDRRFILVQLPEPTGNSAFPTIAEIAKERIRRIAARLRSSPDAIHSSDPRHPADLGFRVFKLAHSVLPYSVLPYSVVSGRSAGNSDARAGETQALHSIVQQSQPQVTLGEVSQFAAVWEVALREGFALTSHIARVPSLSSQTVYRISDSDTGRACSICLDDTIHLEALRPLGLTTTDRFICRDGALDDTAAANLAMQCRLKTV